MAKVPEMKVKLLRLPTEGRSDRMVAAIAAMRGILASNDYTAGENVNNANQYVARNAVSYADALLAELNKEDE